MAACDAFSRQDRGGKDTDWFEKHTVLGAGFRHRRRTAVIGVASASATPGESLTKELVVNAISYQLRRAHQIRQAAGCHRRRSVCIGGRSAWLAGGNERIADDYLGVPSIFYEGPLEYGAPRGSWRSFARRPSKRRTPMWIGCADPCARSIARRDSSIEVLSAWRRPLIVAVLLAVFAGARRLRQVQETLTISRFGPVVTGAAPRIVRSSSFVSCAGIGFAKKYP